MIIKVYKMGNKLGVYIPKRRQVYQRGDIIRLQIKKDCKVIEYISKFNYNIIIRKKFVNDLLLKEGDMINLKIKKIKNLKRSKELFYNNKIDLLSLIPEKTSQGYKIIAHKLLKDNKEWLRLWYSHERGSGRQLEIKRFVDIKKFSSLIGQYQAEGSKNLNKNYPKYVTEFKNKSIEEHNDFLNYLVEIGIQKQQINFSINFNKKNEKDAIKLATKFEKIHNVIVVKYLSNGTKGIGISSMVRNTLLFELINNAMEQSKKRLSKQIITLNEKLLSYSFLSKLLTGDGSIEYKKNHLNHIYCRIKISDGNLTYLKDYKNILTNIGFSPYINGIDVRSKCNKEKLIFLKSINAFRNTKNWEKLNQIIKMI